MIFKALVSWHQESVLKTCTIWQQFLIGANLTFDLSMTLTHCRHQPDQISSLNIAMVKNVWWKRHNKNNVFQSLILMIQKVWLKNIPRMNCGPSSQLSLYTCIIIPLICFQYCIVACIQNWGKLLREHNKY